MRLAIELTSTLAHRLRKETERLGIAPAVLTQPRLSFGDADAYPTLMAKAGPSASPWSSLTATRASGHASIEDFSQAAWSLPLASTRVSAA